jgi:hypothetical protein
MTDATNGTPEPRPRPQYGEYATPEEQRARIQQPYASEALTAGVAPDAIAGSPTPAFGGAAVVPDAATPANTPRTGARNRADLIVTLVLLGLGLIHVLAMAPMLFLFDRAMVFLLDYYGGDSAALTDTTDLRLAGAIAASVMIALWLIAGAVSWWSLRRRRLSFWIPLVAATLSAISTNVLLNGPLSREPALQDLLTRLVGGGS